MMDQFIYVSDYLSIPHDGYIYKKYSMAFLQVILVHLVNYITLHK